MARGFDQFSQTVPQWRRAGLLGRSVDIAAYVADNAVQVSNGHRHFRGGLGRILSNQPPQLLLAGAQRLRAIDHPRFELVPRLAQCLFGLYPNLHFLL